MKKTILTLLLPLAVYSTASVATETAAASTYSSYSGYSYIEGSPTYTYVRCWYRPHHTNDDPATTWEWALDQHGDYYTLDGYWYSSVALKNMFYTDTPHHQVAERCKATLGVTHETADISFYAADNALSYNHTIWHQDPAFQPSVINKMVAFGDSLSDTNNMYNASQWLFPNPNTWFMGRFSNGPVWTEYLARAKQIPLYNWAVGGAAGSNQYVALTGVTEQVNSYLEYRQMAKDYRPANTLFTMVFGLNDFMNYDRSVADVKADFSSALRRLKDAGAQNILLFTLPDATRAPQFDYSTQVEIDTVRTKVKQFNGYIREQAATYQQQGMNVVLVDAYQLFENLLQDPRAFGFENASDVCLNINRSSAADYLYHHGLSDGCAYHGSDKYVFWDVTHPTTATHKFIADQILSGQINQFAF